MASAGGTTRGDGRWGRRRAAGAAAWLVAVVALAGCAAGDEPASGTVGKWQAPGSLDQPRPVDEPPFGGFGDGERPTTADHWHAAYGIYVCDRFLDPLSDQTSDTSGIHTHEDGIVHVHPFTSAATGERATWATFGEAVDLSFGRTGFTLEGTEVADGWDCDGQPGTVALYEWPADDPTAEPIVHTGDLGSVRFSEDRQVFTLAVVPAGTEVPPPPWVPYLDRLSDGPGG